MQLKSETCWKVVCKVTLFIYHHILELGPKIFEKSVRFSENLNVLGGISELKITTIFATVIHYATRPHFILARDNLTSFNKIEGSI